MSYDPDQLQLEIPLQEIALTDERMFRVAIEEQSMLATPTVGHITPDQARIIAGWLDLSIDGDIETIAFPVAQNRDFMLVVKGRNPGTDFPEEPEAAVGDDGVYVPPMFDSNGRPFELPSVIKPAVPEGVAAGTVVFDGQNHVVVPEKEENKEEKTDDVSENS